MKKILKQCCKYLILIIISFILSTFFSLAIFQPLISPKIYLKSLCAFSSNINHENLKFIFDSNIFMISFGKSSVLPYHDIAIFYGEQINKLDINKKIWLGNTYLDKEIIILNKDNIVDNISCDNLNNITVIYFQPTKVILINFNNNNYTQTYRGKIHD